MRWHRVQGILKGDYSRAVNDTYLKMETVRSKTSAHPVQATFLNTSSRFVDLFWVDYHGALVRYYARIPSREQRKLHTFVTHPWLACDADTGQVMYLSGKPVFITHVEHQEQEVRQDGNQIEPLPLTELQINIPIPVYSLEDLCIGFFRRHLSRSDMSLLGVNQFTLQRLTAIPHKPLRDYVPAQSQRSQT